MNSVKNFLTKYKVIAGILVFLLLSFGIYMFVSAEDDPLAGKIQTNANIEEIQSGTPNKDGNWDANDEPGNDSSKENNIVRNFDAIIYKINYNLSLKDQSIEQGDATRKVIIDVLVPTSVNAKVATGDLSNPMGGTKKDEPITINNVSYNYYQFNQNGIDLVSDKKVNVLIYDINMKNGSEIKPIIRLRDEKEDSDFTNDTDLSNVSDVNKNKEAIVVSAKDSWGTKLYPGSSNHDNGRDNPVISLGVVLYIPYDDNKGIKGAQIPENVSLDLNVSKTPADISSITDYSISDYNSNDAIENMPAAYAQNNGKIGKDNITVNENVYTLNYSELTYHDSTIKIGTNENVKDVKYISSKTLTFTTNRQETSKENITYKVSVGNNLVTDNTSGVDIIDNYEPVVGNYQSKVDFRNLKTDTTVVEKDKAVYNYGEQFFIENTINYGTRIGDTLSGFTNYLKIDNDAIKIIDISEGTGKDYTIKFDSENKEFKENEDYSLKYVVGEWSKDYFNNNASAPTYCKDISSLTKDELINYYGGPCVSENTETIKEYTSLNDIPAEESDKIIAIKLTVNKNFKEKSSVTMGFKAIVKSDINLSGKTYQITSRGMTKFNGVDFYMSNPENGIPVNVKNQTQDISYTKIGYDGESISASTYNGQDGNSILVTTAKAKIEKIDVSDKYGVNDKNIYAGQNDPVTITINPIVYSSQVGIIADNINVFVYLPDTLTIDVQTGDKNYSIASKEQILDKDGNSLSYNVYKYSYTEDEILKNNGSIPVLKIHANVSVDTKDNTLSNIYATIDGTVKVNNQKYSINNPSKNRISTKSIVIFNTNIIGLLGVTNPTYIDSNGSFSYNMKATNLSNENANVELLYILPFKGDSLGDSEGSSFNGTISTTINGTLPDGYKAYYTKDSSQVILNNELKNSSNWVEWTNYNTALSGITAIKIVSSNQIIPGDYFASKDGITLNFKTNGNKEADIYYNNFYALHKNGQVCKDENCSSFETGLNMYSSNVSSSSVYNRRISGFAFVDEDYNGFSSGSEEKLKNIAVDLYKTTANVEDYKKPLSVISDSDQKIAETTTDSNGGYSFKGLKEGNYYVKYTFDCDKYTTTEKNKVDNTLGDTSAIDSDAEMKSGTCSAISNIILLDNNNINASNIDLGLRVRQVFDISVNKYISNVTITSNKGVESYDYDMQKRVKLDLRNLKNTSFKVTYTIEIENTKYFPGTVGNIIESIPDGMTFDPNLAENDGWYESDGLLYYSKLDSELLLPGQKYYVTISLNLTTDTGGTYVNFVAVNDLQVQSVISDFTEVKDDENFETAEEVTDDLGEGE